MDADGVAVGDHDVEDDAVAAAVADDVDDGDSPGGSDAEVRSKRRSNEGDAFDGGSEGGRWGV